MASGDFLELAQRACYTARYLPSNADDLARAKEAINECYVSILAMSDRWSFTTKEGQFSITSANDKYTFSSIASEAGVDYIARIYNMTNDSEGGVPLTGIDWLSMEQVSDTTQDNDPRGCPWAFAVFGEQVRFYPWPDQDYTIGMLYQQGDLQMSADADVPLIPYAWRHKILVPYAAARLWEMHSGADALGHARYYNELYTQNMIAFKEAHSAAQFPQIGLDSPTWNQDLPGSVRADYLYFEDV
jgi:hypothetical protein